MNEVRDLFLRGMRDDDADAMRAGFELLFSPEGGVSAGDEHALRHDDYVMEMPQSGERITGPDRMRAMQESFPGPPPTITINRVTGAGRRWLLEGVNDYGDGDLWNVVLSVEFAEDGRMLRDTRYYAKQFAPPEWRAALVDPR